MIPSGDCMTVIRSRIPRESGDDPGLYRQPVGLNVYSPRERG